MATEKECAAMSAIVCNPKKGEGAGPRKLPPPAGWSALTDVESRTDQEGFRVRAYVNAHDDAVLAFDGPDFIEEALAASNEADEFMINVALDMGLACYTGALQRATHAYGLLRQRAAQKGLDPGRIAFTGHGVGGGIASVMAVWFDQPCTVFAQAPLRAVVLTPGDFARALYTIEALLGGADGAVKALQSFIRHPKEVLAQREQLRVTHWHLRGEVYAPLRTSATAIQGAEHAIDIGIHPPTLKTALALHDMTLHAAMLFDPRLPLMCQASPELLSLLIDREDGSDLIDTLISDQHGVGVEAESALQRFVTGLEWRGEGRADGVLIDAAAR
ncbi:alpha/beta hydrolase fold domain-containing protein [Hydrogenophaga sp. IBVHS1]|uniref:alpha/beta hydrolase fold domain-containing protein n=1 Tax=unclassified Hydrogenophaga TaxID=2610897 RepID=UPI000A2D4C20|nr:alpha/beta hydrolase fold domain-containing protein [Hydrogenophaga sp. IBVHS1]OSZ75392.1 hypothetical protein CAP37_08220 [Hydrogenophaga sp. IBVHS1]